MSEETTLYILFPFLLLIITKSNISELYEQKHNSIDEKTSFPEPAYTYGSDHTLYRIEDVDLESDTVYVLTQPEPAVHVFERGDFSESWGKEGRGPGELTNPRSLGTNRNRIVVANMRPNRILWFSPSGTLKKEATIRSGLLTDIEFKSEEVVAQTEEFRGSMVTLAHVSSSDHTERLVSFQSGPSVEIEPSVGPSLTLPAPFQSRTVWTLLENRRIARVEKGSRKVHVKDFHGETLQTLRIPEGAYDVREEDGRAWIYRQLNPQTLAFGQEDPFRKTREEALETLDFPDRYPPALKILSDAKQGVWVLRADRKQGQIWTHLRVNHSPRTVSFPAGLRVSAFGAKYIAGIDRGKNGIELVKLYNRNQVLNRAE